MVDFMVIPPITGAGITGLTSIIIIGVEHIGDRYVSNSFVELGIHSKDFMDLLFRRKSGQLNRI
jgi:hypothetical protein